jgi:hypothetical protein
MNTKLTLTIEDSIIEKAKKYAKSKESSLSNIIENYLKVLVKQEPKHETELTPIVKSLKSSFHSEQDFDYKKALANKLSEKYL